ncbi:unnamed protein product [Adineta ricciae]|uniref:Uncharacterized protein n=1 Tax=Adineta ricciae TaxID=249248 RepID=A0A813S7U9_ADIRI|nr:unnamed protein product [Adineta ricciae]CAF1105806.1 unnamed protein product [Adineta ricciae]
MASNNTGSYQTSITKTTNFSAFDNPHQARINNQKPKRKTPEWIMKLLPCLYGLIIGTLAMGIVLAVILTIWLTRSNSVSSTTNS